MKTHNQTETAYAKRQRRRAERIIKATGAYSPRVRALVQKTLDTNPSQLPRVFAAIDDFDRRKEQFGKGLHAFTDRAYSAALDFYVKHHKDPAALAAFTRGLTEKGGAR